MRYLQYMIFISIISTTACNFIDIDNSEAIKLVQNSKISIDNENNLTLFGLFTNGINKEMTYLEMANRLAQESPNKKLRWAANKTDEDGVYIVSFSEESGWGHFWLVTVNEKIVKHINQNDYLSHVYGLNRLDKSSEFQISQSQVSELKMKTTKGKGKQITYHIKGIVINKTDKIITSAKINGELKLIFKDKTVIGSSKDDFIDMYSSFWSEGNTTNFKSKVTNSKPWKPDETREFQFRTDGIESVYLNYIPEYVVLEINLEAQDPTGYNYSKNIEEIDLKEKWKHFISSNGQNNVSQSNSEKMSSNPRVENIESINNFEENNQVLKSEHTVNIDQVPPNQPSKIEESNSDQKALYPGKKSARNKSNDNEENNSSNPIENNEKSVTLDLEGRKIIKKPVINDSSQETGKVVIEIVVDKFGNVIDVNGPIKGSTTSSPILVQKAKQAAMETKYSESPEGIEQQKGKMTFIFKFE